MTLNKKVSYHKQTARQHSRLTYRGVSDPKKHAAPDRSSSNRVVVSRGSQQILGR